METATINEAKDLAAKKHLYENFEQVITDVDCGKITGNTLNDIIDDAIKIFFESVRNYMEIEADNSDWEDNALR